MSRPIRKTLDPTATDADGLAETQTVAAGGDFVLDGTLVATVAYDRNGVATSQTPAGAGTLTLDGAVGVGFDTPLYITIFGGSDESNKTFTIKGWSPSMGEQSEVLTGPNNSVVVSANRYLGIVSITVSAGTAGAVEVGVQGKATFSTPQHVTLTTTADESGDTVTIYGTDHEGRQITDTIAAAATGVSATTANFATVEKATSDGAIASVTLGVDGTCESAWWPLNYRGSDFNIGVNNTISSGGSLTYTLQHTYDDVFAKGFEADDATAVNDANIAAETGSVMGNLTTPSRAIRMAITAYTSGTLTTTVVQTKEDD